MSASRRSRAPAEPASGGHRSIRSGGHLSGTARSRRVFARDGERRLLGRAGTTVDQVLNRAGVLANDRRVRLGGKVAHRSSSDRP